MKTKNILKSDIKEKLNLRLTEVQTHIKNLNDIYNKYFRFIEDMEEEDFQKLVNLDEYLYNEYSNIIESLSKL